MPELLEIPHALERVANGGPLRAAILLTYGFDAAAAREHLIEYLRADRECRHVIVVGDPRASARSEATRPEPPGGDGSFLYLRAARTPRTFHPKLWFLIGDEALGAFVGSANLTKGGLERNLELGAVLALDRSSGPWATFKAFATYLEGPVRREFLLDGRRLISASSLQRYDASLQAAHEALTATRNAKWRGTPPRFLSNSEEALWPQLLKEAPPDLVEAIVLSPFYEQEDPGEDGDNLLGDLAHRLGRGQIHLYCQSVRDGDHLPIRTLRRAKRIALFERKVETEDKRPLHAKGLVLRGRRRSLVAFGSANFTEAALYTTSRQSNAECLLVQEFPLGAEPLRPDLLASYFTRVRALPTRASHRPETRPGPAWEVVEAVYEVDRRSLTLYLAGKWSKGTRIFVDPIGAPRGIIPRGPYLARHVVTISGVELLAPAGEGDRLNLRTDRIAVRCVAPGGRSLGRRVLRINVDCPERFVRGTLFETGARSLARRIYEAGLGNDFSYREGLRLLARADLGEREALRPVVEPIRRARLDAVHREVREGLRGLMDRLGPHPRELDLRRWVRMVRDWLAETKGSAPDPLAQAEREYIRARLRDHAGAVLRSLAPPLRRRIRRELGDRVGRGTRKGTPE